jgi:hypothetical protein
MAPVGWRVIKAWVLVAAVLPGKETQTSKMPGGMFARLVARSFIRTTRKGNTALMPATQKRALLP